MSRQVACAQPVPVSEHDGAIIPGQLDEPEQFEAVLDPLAGEGDDY
ncbi:MAG: hypothetical protein H0X37_22125 [Herpetosiphonaceae bacterium]|nr:hypothetical protein [Herpetosiphonaceae bacterium]